MDVKFGNQASTSGAGTPSAGNMDYNSYIGSLLSSGQGKGHSGGDFFSLNGQQGHGSGGNLSPILKVVIGGLAAVGAWKLGAGKILKSAYKSIAYRKKPLELAEKNMEKAAAKAERATEKAKTTRQTVEQMQADSAKVAKPPQTEPAPQAG